MSGATCADAVIWGRALCITQNLGFEPLDRSLLDKITAEVRTRKGLKPEPYDAAYYAG